MSYSLLVQWNNIIYGSMGEYYHIKVCRTVWLERNQKKEEEGKMFLRDTYCSCPAIVRCCMDIENLDGSIRI